ncbi:MAG TPA: PHP-associated domain-containing protein [Oscillospiraceae bacterium]|nr:PHP-associated domain-containing protein [Oscillospiraceae bacterium]
MKKFLVETHAHSSEVSSCARCNAKQFTKLMLKHGYSTVFVTNHLSESTINKSKASDWNGVIDFFLYGFELIKKEANGRLNTLLSMEINFNGERNDYLVYGITEKFLRDNKDLTEMTLKTFYPLAKKNGFYVIQAHPFRFGSQIADPKYLDGYEILNGNPRHNSNNDIAKNWALKYKKLTTAGSDFHQKEDIGISGMYFDKEIKSTKDFTKLLESGNYSIKY